MSGSWAKPVDDLSFSASLESEGMLRAATGVAAEGTLPALASGSSLANCFERICRKFPDRTAVTCGQETISYGDLNRQANRIAHGLLALYGQSEVNGSPMIMAIYLDRSIAQISAMLGVVKAGFAYLPIDSTYPQRGLLRRLKMQLLWRSLRTAG